MSEWNNGGGWPSNGGPEVEVEAAPELQLTEEQKDAIITEWMASKAKAVAEVEAEQAARLKVTGALFPTPKKGTQRYISPKGYGSIKLVFGWNYTLGDKDKVDASTGLKVDIATQVDAVLEAVEALGERGAALAERIVKWKPELSVSEYETLAASENEYDIQAKTLIDAILTVKPASPQLTFEPPKAAK